MIASMVLCTMGLLAATQIATKNRDFVVKVRNDLEDHKSRNEDNGRSVQIGATALVTDAAHKEEEQEQRQPVCV